MAIERDHEPKCPDQQTGPVAAVGELRFGVSDGFYAEVRRRVDHYFRGTGRKPRDSPQMYVKTALILGWFAASYVLLVFLVQVWWLACRWRFLWGYRWRPIPGVQKASW